MTKAVIIFAAGLAESYQEAEQSLIKLKVCDLILCP